MHTRYLYHGTRNPIKYKELNSYAIMPVQRTPRYKLFFNELVKLDGNKYGDETAMQVCDLLNQRMNKAVEDEERMENILTLVLSLPLTIRTGIYDEVRQVLKFDDDMIQLINGKSIKCEMFLLNDLILVDVGVTCRITLNIFNIKVVVKNEFEFSLLFNENVLTFQSTYCDEWVNAIQKQQSTSIRNSISLKSSPLTKTLSYFE